MEDLCLSQREQSTSFTSLSHIKAECGLKYFLRGEWMLVPVFSVSKNWFFSSASAFSLQGSTLRRMLLPPGPVLGWEVLGWEPDLSDSLMISHCECCQGYGPSSLTLTVNSAPSALLSLVLSAELGINFLFSLGQLSLCSLTPACLPASNCPTLPLSGLQAYFPVPR